MNRLCRPPQTTRQPWPHYRIDISLSIAVRNTVSYHRKIYWYMDLSENRITANRNLTEVSHYSPSKFQFCEIYPILRHIHDTHITNTITGCGALLQPSIFRLPRQAGHRSARTPLVFFLEAEESEILRRGSKAGLGMVQQNIFQNMDINGRLDIKT